MMFELDWGRSNEISCLSSLSFHALLPLNFFFLPSMKLACKCDKSRIVCDPFTCAKWRRAGNSMRSTTLRYRIMSQHLIPNERVNTIIRVCMHNYASQMLLDFDVRLDALSASCRNFSSAECDYNCHIFFDKLHNEEKRDNLRTRSAIWRMTFFRLQVQVALIRTRQIFPPPATRTSAHRALIVQFPMKFYTVPTHTPKRP